MTLRARVLGPVLCLAFLLVVVPATARDDPDPQVLQFEIKDQFDTLHTEREFRGRPVLVICSDRKGSQFQDAWVAAIRDSSDSRGQTQVVQLIEAADLRGVPFFIKGKVKNKFPRERAAWVLMDWKGHLAKTYDTQKDKCSLLLFDGRGRLVYHTAGEDPSALVIDEILENVAALQPGSPVIR